jgi:hypothetical protein
LEGLSACRSLCTRFLLLLCSVSVLVGSSEHFPAPEKLTYNVEWRLIDAGTAAVQLTRDGGGKNWNFSVNIVSAGLVSRLYHVSDKYNVTSSDRFCALKATLDAQEGKKHALTRFNLDYGRNKVIYEDQDLVRGKVEKRENDIVPCTYEIIGALAAVRTANLPPGKSTVMPITDGKKFAQAKIESLGKETINVGGTRYTTTRYEAFVFDNILYKRRGRLLMWISDDPGHLPVQFRLLMGFPIGTITVSLQKVE